MFIHAQDPRGLRRRAGGLALLAAALIVAPGCDSRIVMVNANANRVNQKWSGSVKATAPVTLTIDNPVGNITLVPDSADAVSVEAVKKAQDDKALAEVEVKLTGSGKDISLKSQGPRGGNWSVD